MVEPKRALTRFLRSASLCSICLDYVSIRGKLSACDHFFCFDCVIRWAERENTCPICKIRFRWVKREALRRVYGGKGNWKVEVEERTQDKPVPVFPPC